MSMVLIDSKNNTAYLIAHSDTHGTFRSLIDIEDAEKVAVRTWSVWKGKSQNQVYFRTNVTQSNGKQKTLPLHRFITNAPADALVDHKNPDDTLDNRRSNLRLATRSENKQNSRSHRGSRSRFKGVSWCNDRSKWRTHIRVNGKLKSFGRYHSETEAAKAYDVAARELFGEFAYLNFPLQVAA